MSIDNAVMDSTIVRAMGTSDEPEAVGAVTQALDKLATVVRTQRWAADIRPWQQALEAWGAEAQELDTLVAGGGAWTKKSWRLAQAADPAHVAALVTYRPNSGGQAGYFAPVIAAWAMLGVAEYRYQEYGDHGLSFFAWWVEQPLGPWTFSAALAVLLLGLSGWMSWRVRVRARAAVRRRATFETECVAFSHAVVEALGQWDARRSESGEAITQASANLLAGAAELQRVADGLSSGSTGSGAVASVDALNRTLVDLERQMERVVHSTQSMATTAERIPQRLEGLAADLEGFAELREMLTAHVNATEAASERFAKGAESMTASLPLVDVAIGRSHELAGELVAAEKSAREFAAKVDGTYASVSSGLATQLVALNGAVQSMQAVAQEMSIAATRLQEGVVVADSLKSLG